MKLLEVEGLRVRFTTPDGCAEAVRGVSFAVEERGTLAIVGRSGSGKSQSAYAVMGLLPANGQASGSVRYRGEEILNLPDKGMNRFRSREIALVFQNPMTSLNPYMRISAQLSEVLIHHQGMGRRTAIAEAVRMLDAVRIPDAANRVHMYPHEFSGGMRQRVVIAMALLCRPKLLIADEPTTALDALVQSRIVDLLMDLLEEFGMALILITHDFGLVAGTCRNAIVMENGKVVESNAVDAMFRSPAHPCTRSLLDSVPSLRNRQGEAEDPSPAGGAC